VNRLTRTVLVDDFEPWRSYVRSVLDEHPRFEIVAEASDGMEAVRRVEELQPNLVLLDIGLPSIDGIAAARLMQRVAPDAKILFLSENRNSDIAEAALNAGGRGYVVKSDCAHDLLIAMGTVLQGEKFVSRTLDEVSIL
jgi:DNA-binding NarL/FixJ family response regulator